ncbi:MAG: peptidoglycan-binding protein [Acetobacteraceae bacterium]|nr:peptidoglycan-binding protein [Acetobacteraceae bacterium]
MKIDLRAAVVAAGVLAAGPAFAQQQNQQTAPVHPGSSTIMQVQEKLNQQGFKVGQADGQWGPHTSEAVRNYQEKHGLQATGELDQQTLASLGISEQATGSSTMQPSSSSGGTAGSMQQNNQGPHR